MTIFIKEEFKIGIFIHGCQKVLFMTYKILVHFCITENTSIKDNVF